MGKSAEKVKADIDHAILERESGRGFGLAAVIAVVTVVGVVVWLMMNNHRAN